MSHCTYSKDPPQNKPSNEVWTRCYKNEDCNGDRQRAIVEECERKGMRYRNTGDDWHDCGWWYFSGKCVPRCNEDADSGLCKFEVDPVDVTRIHETINDAAAMVQDASRTPCSWIACEEGANDVLKTFFPNRSPKANASVEDFLSHPCRYVDCKSLARDAVDAVPLHVRMLVLCAVGALVTLAVSSVVTLRRKA